MQPVYRDNLISRLYNDSDYRAAADVWPWRPTRSTRAGNRGVRRPRLRTTRSSMTAYDVRLNTGDEDTCGAEEEFKIPAAVEREFTPPPPAPGGRGSLAVSMANRNRSRRGGHKARARPSDIHHRRDPGTGKRLPLADTRLRFQGFLRCCRNRSVSAPPSRPVTAMASPGRAPAGQDTRAQPT